MKPNDNVFSEKDNKTPVFVLLASVYDDADKEKECLKSLEELKKLAETSIDDKEHYSKFFFLTQCRKTPDVATFIGRGKADEAKKLCADNNITLVIVDGEMSPSQIKNLEDALNTEDSEIKVIDRTMLILDIFAKHAVTGEGKIQVEIAQLKYTSPRLTGRGISLSRQGGTSGSIGARGPGETKLETDKRHIQRRILSLKNELAELEKERAVKRAKRQKSGIPTVAITGYTNAGKSTLLTYLTNAGILAEDKLFATLDTTVRRLTLPSSREILLTDTVGFINNLPHGLVEAFKSTLDEVVYADVLLIVIDISDEDAKMKLEVTEKTLEELGASGKPTVYAFNKSDLAEFDDGGALPSDVYGVSISAQTGKGVGKLLEILDMVLSASKKRIKLLIPFGDSSAVNYLYRNAVVESAEYTENGTLITALVTDKEIGACKKFII
ncbi:MAG: GTPase HflX [Clostridia bacterium]|nr:GTPase HflX [Clostridia bacterium]